MRIELKKTGADEIFFWGNPQFPSGEAVNLAHFLKYWTHDGLYFFTHIKGSWALAARIDGKIILARDHYGFQSLYFCQDDQKVTAASFQSELTDLKAEQLDEEVIACFLMDDFSLKDRSFCLNVTQVSPGTITTIQNETTLSKPFEEKTAPALFKENSTEAGKKWRELILQSLERGVSHEKKIGLILSGGLDSSGLLALLIHLKNNNILKCEINLYHLEFLQGPENTEGLARKLAQEFNLPIFCINLQLDSSQINWKKEETAWDLPYFPTFQMYEPLLVQAKKDGCSMVLFGYGADEQLTPPLFFLADLLKNFRWKLLWHHIIRKKFYNEPLALLPRMLLKPLIPRGLRDQLRKFKKNRKIPQPFLNHPMLKKFYSAAIERWSQRPSQKLDIARQNMWVRLRTVGGLQYSAEVHALLCEKQGLRCYLPYFDPDLIRFSLSLPLEFLIDMDLEKSILRKSLEGLLSDEVRGKPKFQDYSDFTLAAVDRQKNLWLSSHHLVRRGWLPESYKVQINLNIPSHDQSDTVLKIQFIENILSTANTYDKLTERGSHEHIKERSSTE